MPNFRGSAKDLPPYDNEWHLHKLVLDGSEFPAPFNNEVTDISLQIG
ncbi:hypothetical protein [Patiriisocius sp. Uisw_017]|jgi:hypothetical protein